MYYIDFFAGVERNARPFDSIPEVRTWADRQNYVLGKPEPHICTFAIRHLDGSPLKKEELAALQPEDSETLYQNRERAALEALGARTGIQVGTLRSGADHVALMHCLGALQERSRK